MRKSLAMANTEARGRSIVIARDTSSALESRNRPTP